MYIYICVYRLCIYMCVYHVYRSLALSREISRFLWLQSSCWHAGLDRGTTRAHVTAVSRVKALSLAMAACGWDFTVVVTQDGAARAFCNGCQGQLGLGAAAPLFLPARVGGREVFNALVVMVATGHHHHAAAVVADGRCIRWVVVDTASSDRVMRSSGNNQRGWTMSCLVDHRRSRWRVGLALLF